MNDDMNEQLSAFIDDELHDDVLLREIAHNQQAQQTVARYQLIGDVLNNRYVPGSLDVSARVHSALEQEATIIAPKKWFAKVNVMKQVAGLAVAATVAAVAILVVGDFSASVNSAGTIAAGPTANQPIGTITNQPIQMTSAMQSKLNGYLVSHNEFSASSRMKGMLPYYRIASSVRGERVEVKAGAKLEK